MPLDRIYFKILIKFWSVLAFALSTITSCQTPPPHTDHFDGAQFLNPASPKPDRGLFDIFKWKLTSTPTPWPQEIVRDNVSPDRSPINAAQMRVTYINHATVLLEWQGFTVLTDPILSEKVGPISFLNMSRKRLPGLTLEQLPKIDLVVISHNHYDHLDLPTINALEERDHPLFLVPLKVASYLSASLQKCTIELDWWQSHRSKELDLEVTLVPMLHWSKRTLFDTNRSLWGGFVISKGSHKILFAGDTGYSDHFKKIAAVFPHLDVALLPIGSYEPRYLMKDSHLNPDEAVQVASDLRVNTAIGIHFGTFQLTDEGMEAPVVDLEKALRQRQYRGFFYTPKHGQSYTFDVRD